MFCPFLLPGPEKQRQQMTVAVRECAPIVRAAAAIGAVRDTNGNQREREK